MFNSLIAASGCSHLGFEGAKDFPAIVHCAAKLRVALKDQLLLFTFRTKAEGLLFELATEPLEETFERLETLREINYAVDQLPPLQRQRFVLHFIYGYSYSEIAEMQGCYKAAVMRSAQSALKKIRKDFAA